LRINTPLSAKNFLNLHIKALLIMVEYGMIMTD